MVSKFFAACKVFKELEYLVHGGFTNLERDVSRYIRNVSKMFVVLISFDFSVEIYPGRSKRKPDVREAR